MKKKFMNITMMMLLIIALTSIVSSELLIETYSSDFFSGAVTSNPEVCICGSFTDEIVIKNTAIYPQVFELRTNLERAVLSINQVTLKPEEQIKIPIVLTSDCSERPKIENYDVFIRSTTGVEKTIQRTLELNQCQTIKTELYTDKNDTYICEPLNYSIVLENPSTFTEDYLITPTKNIEWFDEEGYEVTLNPEEKSMVNFVFTSDCAFSGETSNKFKIKALNSKVEANLEHLLNVKPGYDFTIIGENEPSVCRQEIQRINYELINEGLIDNTYTINLKDNPDFIKIEENNTFTLKTGESKNIALELSPRADTKDNYEFSLEAKTHIGNELLKKDISLSIIDCYDSSLIIKTPEALKVCQGEQELTILIQNKGLYEETYNIHTNSELATLSNQTITIPEGQEETIRLFINSSNLEGKTLFEVEAHAHRDMLKHWEDIITLDIVPQRQCSEILFPWGKTIRSRYYEDNVTIKIRNTGIEESSFKINYEGSDFLELLENETTIQPNQYYELFLNKTRENESEEYFFSIELISEKGEAYKKEFRLKITETPITEELIEYTKENPCFGASILILLIILIFLIILIITGPLLGRKTKLITTTIIIILVIIGLIIYGLPQKVNPDLEQSEDPYEFKIYDDEKLIINMNDYVTDPDGDSLTFKLEDEPTNLTLEITEQLIKITPTQASMDRFKIIAKDNRSGEVTTPRFNIETIEKTRLNLQELYEFYCAHLNMIFLLILATLVFFSGNKKQKTRKKTQQKTQQKPKKKIAKKKATKKQTKK